VNALLTFSEPWRMSCVVLYQISITPGVLRVPRDNSSTIMTVDVALLAEPTSHVTVNTSIPLGWDGKQLAMTQPDSLFFDPASWNVTQQLLVVPQGPSQGNYHVKLLFT
jgi:hypothetical protein